MSRPRSITAGVAVALVVAAYGAIWLPQGIDVTDEGFHLTNQHELIRTGFRADFDSGAAVTWLSDAAGALWSWAAGPGLFAARLGWLVMTVASAWLAWRILARVSSPWRAAVVVMSAAPMLLVRGRMLIDYNGMPALLMLAAVDVMTGRSVPTARSAAVSGALLALAAGARWPSLVAGTLIAMPTIGRLRWNRVRWLELAGYAGGLAAIIATLVAWHRGLGDSVMQGVFGASAGHRLPELAVNVIGQSKWIAVSALVWWMACRLTVRLGVVSVDSSPVFAVAVFGAIVSGTVGTLWRAGAPAAVLIQAVVLIGGCVVAAWPRRSATSVEAVRLVRLGLVVGVASVIGSDTGVVKMTHALWLAVPAAILVAGDSAKTWPARRLIAAGAAALALSSAIIRFVSPYRDAPDRRTLTTPIQDVRLRGILTTPGRAESMRAVLAAVRERVHPGDPVLAYGGTPLIYALTDTVPAVGHPWIEIAEEIDVGRRLSGLGVTRPAPIIAVRAAVDTADPRWGTTGDSAAAPSAIRREIGDWLARHQYRVVWSNREFEVLERSAR